MMGVGEWVDGGGEQAKDLRTEPDPRCDYKYVLIVLGDFHWSLRLLSAQPFEETRTETHSWASAIPPRLKPGVDVRSCFPAILPMPFGDPGELPPL